ncbi:Importin subunit alpha [Hondaea fermentalgiana]|uniref:Importin subunit alpha n=1 Tax=Hondaea fermentalgiana TaxID=2315210 RepID=A0A2R5GB21_9STRA|nr:Importin subunit alpha [Hondaea fermentalgiana]|eukprot:GBG28200.1 Importin subunit alpha [Hondaea fermentalgiana]
MPNKHERPTARAPNSSTKVNPSSSFKGKSRPSAQVLPRVKNVDPHLSASEKGIDNLANHADALAAQKREKAKLQRQKELAEQEKAKERLDLLLGHDDEQGEDLKGGHTSDTNYDTRLKPGLLEHQVGSGRSSGSGRSVNSSTRQSPLRKRRLRNGSESDRRTDSKPSAQARLRDQTHKVDPHAEQADGLVVDTSRGEDPVAFFKVLHAFEAVEDDDISINKEDILRVRQEDMHSDGWWYGAQSMGSRNRSLRRKSTGDKAESYNASAAPRNEPTRTSRIKEMGWVATKAETPATPKPIAEDSRETSKAPGIKVPAPGLRVVRKAQSEDWGSQRRVQTSLTPLEATLEVHRVIAARLANRLIADVIVAVSCSLLTIPMPGGDDIRFKDVLEDLRSNEPINGASTSKMASAVRVLRQAQAIKAIPHEIVGASIVNFVPELIRICLDVPSALPRTLRDTTLVLSNIVAEHPESCYLVTHEISRFAERIGNTSGDLDNAILCLIGNVAGSSLRARDDLLAIASVRKGIERIISAGSIGSPALQNAIWALGNLYRGFPPPVGIFSSQLAIMLTQLLIPLRDDPATLVDLLWTIAFMCEAHDMANAFADESLHADLISAVMQTNVDSGDLHDSNILMLGALRALGNLVCSCPLVPSRTLVDDLLQLADHLEPMIQKEIMWIIGNIVNVNTTLLEYTAGQPELWGLLRKAISRDVPSLRAEAIFLAHNLLKDGSEIALVHFEMSFPKNRQVLQQLKCPNLPPIITKSLKKAIDDITSVVFD